MKTDLYQKVTDQIVASLEHGVRPGIKPWSAEHAAGRITRPLCGNGIAYQGVNVLVLWSEAVLQGYSAPIWMTFRQAVELGACVRKGEHGTTVVYATPSPAPAPTGERRELKPPRYLAALTLLLVMRLINRTSLGNPGIQPGRGESLDTVNGIRFFGVSTLKQRVLDPRFLNA